jgi:glycine betaine/choline ABC-type transport system substrate-binding protein
MGRTQILAGLTLAGLLAAVGAAGLAGLFAGCTRDRPIVVGSKNFTEQVILGEIVAQHLEHRLGTAVARKLNLGGTLLAHQALVQGDIDVYPEYTGTALTAILKLPPPADPAAVAATVRAEYQSRFHIQLLPPLGFNNTFAMVIRGEDARRNRLATLSEAAGYPSGWTLGVGYEFQQRPDGLDGLLKAYGLRLNGSVKTMDLGLLYKALEEKQVGMVAANATDGLLSKLDVVVLLDDKAYFLPYQAVLAVRAEALQASPPLGRALEELSGKFSNDVMRKLNYQIDGEHRPIREVARAFLQDSRLY